MQPVAVYCAAVGFLVVVFAVVTPCGVAGADDQAKMTFDDFKHQEKYFKDNEDVARYIAGERQDNPDRRPSSHIVRQFAGQPSQVIAQKLERSYLEQYWHKYVLPVAKDLVKAVQSLVNRNVRAYGFCDDIDLNKMRRATHKAWQHLCGNSYGVKLELDVEHVRGLLRVTRYLSTEDSFASDAAVQDFFQTLQHNFDEYEDAEEWVRTTKFVHMEDGKEVYHVPHRE